MEKLLQDIKANEFKNVYLLYGEEAYLLSQFKDNLRRALISSEDTMNLNQYEGKNIEIPALIDQAETLPFFSDRRVLFVEDSGFFKKSPQELVDYMEHIPETTFFIFVESEVDARSKLYKAVAKYGRCVEFKRQKEDRIIKWILGILKREGKNITRSTMELFLDKTGPDMKLIQSELEKLLTYTMGREVITSEDVEAICTTRTENKIFDMINDIAEKRQKQALDRYYDLLTLKEPPMRILFLVSRQFNQLLQVKDLRQQGYDSNTIAGKIGVHSFAVRNLLRQAEYFSQQQIMRMVSMCVNLEEAVKTGNMNEKLAVELAIIRCSRN